MDFSPPDSSVHGFFQARILEWVTISFSRILEHFKDLTPTESQMPAHPPPAHLFYKWGHSEAALGPDFLSSALCSEPGDGGQDGDT